MTYKDYPQSWPTALIGEPSSLFGRQVDWANVANTVFETTVDGMTYKAIPAFTLMSEQPDGTMIPRLEAAQAGGAAYVLLTDADSRSKSDAISGYGVMVGGMLITERMPDYYTNHDPAAGLSADWAAYLTELQAANPLGFAFEKATTTIN